MSDLRQYTQELFKKAGITEDKTKAILEALGDDAVAKAIRDGFVETPQHHSTLDKSVGEWKGKASDAEKRAAALEKWYEEQAKPAYGQYQTAFQKLQRYEQTYGPIDGTGDQRAAAVATGMTKEEVDAYVKAQLQQRDNAYVGVAKDISWATADYAQRFKDTLDLDQIEKLALERGTNFRQAYKDFVAPKMEEQRNQEWEAKIKAAREEGARDALSKHQLPVDTRPRDPHPFFERQAEPAKMDELQQENHSRSSFMDGWNNYAEKAS